MFEVDNILTGERFRNILRDLAIGNYDSIKSFINEFDEYAEDEFSDSFVHKMQTLCRFLIDVKAYEYVAQILELSSIIGTYESENHEGEECVVSYAVRKIKDESKIANILEHCKGGELTVYFYEYAPPAMIAIDLKKYQTLKVIFEISDLYFGFTNAVDIYLFELFLYFKLFNPTTKIITKIVKIIERHKFFLFIFFSSDYRF